MTTAAWIDGTMWALYAWHGIHPGLPHVRFWTTPADPRHTLRINLQDTLLNRVRIDAADLGPEALRRAYGRAVRSHAVYIHGYPTAIASFVDFCNDAKLPSPLPELRVIFSTGELLSPQVRRKLEDFFGVGVVNEYGCSESGLLGFECEAGALHAIPTTAYVEVLAADGSPAGEGEEGDIVITDLLSPLFPLVRYKLGDRGKMLPPLSCPCGRELPVLGLSVGRSSSFIQLPDHRRVFSSVLSQAMPRSVRRFQAEQLSLSHLHFQLVLEPDVTLPEVRRIVSQRLQNVLPHTMLLTFEEVAPSALPVRGKHRYFVPFHDKGEPLTLSKPAS
jgi:phenylacetate-CoA ligase